MTADKYLPSEYLVKTKKNGAEKTIFNRRYDYDGETQKSRQENKTK